MDTGNALMSLIIKTLRLSPVDKLDKLLREHEGYDGHCRCCHTVAPCTLWSAAMSARYTKKIHPVEL